MNMSSTQPVVSSSNPIRQLAQRHPLICYFLMAYTFSWLGWLPYILSQSGLGVIPVSLSEIAILPGAFLGPFMSGFLMTAATDGKAGVQRLLRRFVLWRVGWQWYLVALVGIPMLIFLGYLILPGALAVIHTPFPQILWVFPLLLVVEIFSSGLAEEPGWRGFALPRLQQRNGPLWGTLILGTLWGCWHLPLFLTTWSAAGRSLFDIIGFVLTTIGMAILITWVYNHTRTSLLLSILMHAALDAAGSTLVATGLFQMQWFVQHVTMGQLAGFVGVPLLVVILTRGRLGYQQAPSSSQAMSSPTDENQYRSEQGNLR